MVSKPHLGLDIEPARLVNELARLAKKLEPARLAREPNHKNTVQGDLLKQ